MLTLQIENEQIEKIFLDGFHSNKEQFFEFIQKSYETFYSKEIESSQTQNLINLQEISMAKTWDNKEDEVWDEL